MCGYWRFRYSTCGRQFNERSASVLNRTCLPSDIIASAVFCRRHYRLPLRDLSEILALCGREVRHDRAAKQIDERDRETKLLAVMGSELRKCGHGSRRDSGDSWHFNETYLKVRRRWCSSTE